jgi:hypothetical protein
MATRTVRREAIGLYAHVKARPREVEPVAKPANLDRMLAHRLRKPALHE